MQEKKICSQREQQRKTGRASGRHRVVGLKSKDLQGMHTTGGACAYLVRHHFSNSSASGGSHGNFVFYFFYYGFKIHNSVSEYV